jgi:hypothetical protein
MFAMNSPAFYFEHLYPLQDQVLKIIRQVDTGFYLTGGTAASRGYLKHRFSDDLDFFVNDDDRFGLWVERLIQALLQTGNQSWQCQVLMKEERFARLNLITGELVLKIEMVNDVPARVGQVHEDPVLGRLDTAENILANKVTALLDREEPKDLADIWGFCCLRNLSLHEAISHAGSKAAGVFPADLARLLCSATSEDWQVVRWIAAPSENEFLEQMNDLGEQLLLLS